jgi:NADH-quinone oxidoreductase subunit N
VAEAVEQIHRTASLIVPEIILLAAACLLFLAGPFAVSDAGQTAPGLRHRWGFISLLAFGLAWTVWFGGSAESSQGALFSSDALAWYARGLTLTAGILLAIVLWNQIDDGHAAEAQACLLAILAGTNLVAAASDLVSMFLALELVSIPTYVILYLSRRDRAGREATVKYFLLSVFSSALVLYGMSWLYGVAGSTNLAAIGETVRSTSPAGGNRLLQLAFALLLAGLSFRIAAVPFHFYAPDVFQGTTAANAGLLSFIPKVVGFVALVRLLPLSGASQSVSGWLPDDAAQSVLATLAVVTMFVGNLMALRQKNLYRLMAYSSVAHAGYMTIGLVVGDVGRPSGTDALLFYLAAYGLMTIGVFALLSAATIGGRPIQIDDDLRGLAQSRFSLAILLAICLFSLTGLPPTAGFLAKLNLFLAAWSDASRVGPGLSIVMALNAAIAAWYYLRLVALVFLDPPAATEVQPGRVAWTAYLGGIVCAVATIWLFISPQWLWNSVP